MNPYKEILRKFFSEYVSALRKRRGTDTGADGGEASNHRTGIQRFGAGHILLFHCCTGVPAAHAGGRGNKGTFIFPSGRDRKSRGQRGGVVIHGDGGYIRAFALAWTICGKHSLFSHFVCGLSDDTAASPDAVCRMVAVPGSCRTLSHLHFRGFYFFRFRRCQIDLTSVGRYSKITSY